MRSRLHYFIQTLYTPECDSDQTKRADLHHKAQQLRGKLQSQMNQLLNLKVQSGEQVQKA